MHAGISTPIAELHVHHSDGRKLTLPLDRGSLVVGRDASCELALDDPLASRRHVRIFRDPAGHWWVEDLRSKNGTLLNEQPVQKSPLKHGDRVTVGTSNMTLRTGDPPATRIVLDEGTTELSATSISTSSTRLHLPQQRLEKLYELHERLAGRFERDDLLREVINVCMESLNLERVGLALWAGENSQPQWVVVKNQRPSSAGEFRISRTLVDRSLHKGERILIKDPALDMIDPTVSMVSNHICSAMCVPLIYHNQVKGVLYGDRVTSSGGYSNEDLDFFGALGRQAAMGLANVHLLEEMQRNKRIEADLALARQIQNHLLPREPLLHGGLTIAAINDPGRKVSGDYFDYLARPDGLVTLVIADVSGKGVPASLLMANLQAAVHVTLVEGSRDLGPVVGRLNKLICQNVDSDRFITGIFGLLDPRERTFTFVNVGHPPPLLLRANGVVQPLPDPTSLPLGIEENVIYEPVVYPLGPGASTLFFYTDGVPDAENDKDEHFGEARLTDLLKAGTADTPADLLQRVRRSVQQFVRHTPQIDDITMVAANLA